MYDKNRSIKSTAGLSGYSIMIRSMNNSKNLMKIIKALSELATY